MVLSRLRRWFVKQEPTTVLRSTGSLQSLVHLVLSSRVPTARFTPVVLSLTHTHTPKKKVPVSAGKETQRHRGVQQSSQLPGGTRSETAVAVAGCCDFSGSAAPNARTLCRAHVCGHHVTAGPTLQKRPPPAAQCRPRCCRQQPGRCSLPPLPSLWPWVPWPPAPWRCGVAPCRIRQGRGTSPRWWCCRGTRPGRPVVNINGGGGNVAALVSSRTRRAGVGRGRGRHRRKGVGQLEGGGA